MSPLPSLNQAIIIARRSGEDITPDQFGDPFPNTDVQTVAVISYTLAFVVAAALTVYVVAYFKPPSWYGRLRGHRPPPPADSSPSSTAAWDGGDNSGGDRAAGGWKGKLGGLWSRLTVVMMTTMGHRRGGGGGGGGRETGRKSSVPSDGIRRTAAYTVWREPASAAAGAGDGGGGMAWPLRDVGGKDASMAGQGPSKKDEVYGGGKLPWGTA